MDCNHIPIKSWYCLEYFTSSILVSIKSKFLPKFQVCPDVLQSNVNKILVFSSKYKITGIDRRKIQVCTGNSKFPVISDSYTITGINLD